MRRKLELLHSSTESEALTHRLIEESQAQPINYETSLNWALGVNRSLKPKNLDHLWIKGLAIEHALTDEQRLEIAWLEIARDISVLIWFEQTLIPIYTDLVSKTTSENIKPAIRDYLTIFAKEEIVHVLCFRRFMKLANLPYFSPPHSYIDVFKKLNQLQPIMTLLTMLLIEWVAENIVMFSTQEEDIDPLTRQLFSVHHADKIRHLAFGRAITEDFFTTCIFEEKNKILATVKETLLELINHFTYDASISRFVSFSWPVLPCEHIEPILNSKNNRFINQHRFKDISCWIEKLEGLIHERPSE